MERCRTLRVVALLTVVGAMAMGGWAPTAEARRGGRTSFRDKTAGIQIFLPGTWKRQMRSAFPGVLVTFKHGKLNARIILAAKRRKVQHAATTLAEQNVAVLKKRRWQVSAITATRLGKLAAVEFVATHKKTATHIRQVYAIRRGFAYVLTLIAPVAQSVKLRTDLLFVQKATRFR